MKIDFSEKDISESKKFSNLINTDFYSTRNQFNSNKRIEDVYIGKLAELTVYHSLINNHPNISYPDFNIYPVYKKSWDYDLKSDNFNLHVKSVRFNSKYGISWIFENTDKHIFKLYSEKDYIAFVSINMLQKYGEIKNILPVSLLHELQLFKKPVLAKLISKSAIYYDDIKNIEMHLI